MRAPTAGRNKGFTLIELIVAIAVMGIVLSAVAGIFAMGTRLVRRTGTKFDEHAAALSLMKRVTLTVQNSASLAIYADPAGTDPAGLDGYLYYDPAEQALKTRGSSAAAQAVYRPGIAVGYDVSVTFRAAGSAALTVAVTVASHTDPQDSYTLTGETALPNLSLHAASITDATGGGAGTLLGFSAYMPPGG